MKRFLSALVAVLAVQAQAQVQTPAQAQTEPATPTLEITAKLGSGIEDRELVEETTQFQVGDKAYLWMRLTGGPSAPITVTWSIDEHTYDVRLEVGGASWRTWSHKTLWMAGEWSVEVNDAKGNALFSSVFNVRMPTSEMVEDTAKGTGAEPR